MRQIPREPEPDRFRETLLSRAISPVSRTNGRRPAAKSENQSLGFYIKQTASIVGVSPAQIRAWENRGLLTPARTPSGYRVFSPQDIERLRYIRDQILRDGLNPAGVRRMLSITDAKIGNKRPRSMPVGERIRTLRRRSGLSLRAVATLTGLSPSSISAVERGLSSPTVGSLHRLAVAFKTTIPILMGTPEPHQRLVVRPHERTLLFGAPGVEMENLYDTETFLQSMLITIEPGAGSQESYSHEGEEMLYVIEGEIEMTLDEIDNHRVQAGDAMTFHSTRPHRWTNPGAVTAVIVWVNSPPTF